MTRTRSHLVFGRSQQRARPSQGGAFHPPAGPVNDTTAQWHANTWGDQRGTIHEENDPRWVRTVFLAEDPIDWSDAVPAKGDASAASLALDLADEASSVINIFYGAAPAAPPVDAELEAERVRLVGKRVRSSTRHVVYGLCTKVERDEHGLMWAEVPEADDAWRPCFVEPIPEEPRTIHDAKVGDRVEHIASGMIGVVESFDLAWRMVHVRFNATVMERMSIVNLVHRYRLAPSGGGA